MRRKQQHFPIERLPARGFPRTKQEDSGGVFYGTVGWDNGAPHFEHEDGGMTLLRVTLYQGHNPATEGENTTPGRARGRTISVRIDPEVDGIPDDGAHVIVAIPSGLGDVPGGGVLLKVTRAAPKWVPNRKSGEKIIYGPNDSFIRFNEEGTLYGVVKSGDNPDTAKPVQFELSKDGFRVNHPHGELYCDSDGWGFTHSSGAKMSGGAIGGLPPPLDALSSFINLESAIFRVKSSAIALGSGGHDNLLRATPTLGVLSAMMAAISALQTTMTALLTDLLAVIPFSTTSTPPPTASVANGLAVTAVGAATSALAAGAINAPTTSVTGG